jgi:hypothetical protein
MVKAMPRLLYPRERHGTHCIGGWMDPRAGLDGCGKSRLPPGLDPRTVQPIASTYTNHCLFYPSAPPLHQTLDRTSHRGPMLVRAPLPTNCESVGSLLCAAARFFRVFGGYMLRSANAGNVFRHLASGRNIHNTVGWRCVASVAEVHRQILWQYKQIIWKR